MDEIVKQAMEKWPNVPHCYGWLILDGRGAWRMRDERCQALSLPGDKITNPALLAFINRNYTHDAQGRWYFQNGPQRVYVTLEATPYIAHTNLVDGETLPTFVLQTNEALKEIDTVWLTEDGQFILQGEGKIAMVDDRDTAQCMAQLYIGEQPARDEQLLAWLENPSSHEELTMRHAKKDLLVKHILRKAAPHNFDFVAIPEEKNQKTA